MDRNIEMKISFDTANISQVFIHTSGSYLIKPISKHNNYYLRNFENVPSSTELKKLAIEINATKSSSKQNKIINGIKERLDIDQTVQAIPLTFCHDVEKMQGYIVFEQTTNVEKYDLSILDFISYDFNVFNDYLLFFINFFDYSLGAFDKKDANNIELDTLYPVEKIVELAKKYYDKEKDNLIYYQGLFRKCINFVYCIENPLEEEIKDLTIKQRFFLYNTIYKFDFESLANNFRTSNLLKYEYDNFPLQRTYNIHQDVHPLISAIKEHDYSGRHLRSLNQYLTYNLFTAFYITLFNLVSINKLHVKLCNNCNRYFITTKENVAYCDRILYDNVTCKDIGTKLSQKRKEDSLPVYRRYRKIFAKKRMHVKRNPDIEKYQIEYENFKKESNQFKKNIQNGIKTYEDFDKWLDTQDR